MTAAKTQAYFRATANGPFDHQRDAYEQGYEDGAAAKVDRLKDDDAWHASLVIACLVRRLGGHVTIDPAELANEPAAMATVGTSGGFEIKVLEPDPPGPDLIDMGYLSLPAEVQRAVEHGLAGTRRVVACPVCGSRDEYPLDWPSSWPADHTCGHRVDEFGRSPGPSLLDVGYVERSPTMLGGSLNPSPDCGGPRKPPDATELWWCDSHTQFHGPAAPSTTGGDQ